MAIKLPQITPEQIYVSRLAHHWVLSDEGWGRMEPVDKTVPPTGCVIMDAVAHVLARTRVTDAREVAAALHVSLADLHGVIRILTGMRLGQFILRYRLLEAQELLAKTDLPMSEIAKRMGKQNQESFSRLIRLHLKCSPMTYRQMHRKKNYRRLYKL